MSKRVSVVGASLGGLIAAAELRRSGFDVTIVERGKTVGGLYNKIDTPFGVQELGMHVLYVSDVQYEHLCSIFGADTFHVLRGSDVDVGACANFDKVCFNSLYPNVVGHPLEREIFSQVAEAAGKRKVATNSLEEVVNRFGPTAGQQIVAPILKKLWHMSPEKLSKHAVHCFFDLRRMIVCDKPTADELKQDPWLDDVIGNPDQRQPRGAVHDGRRGLTFRSGHPDLAQSVKTWAQREGITLAFEKNVSVIDGSLSIDGTAAQETCDACIIALPMHSLAGEILELTDRLDLSVYYFKLSHQLTDEFPAYYILGHSEKLKSSRIVNYDAYDSQRIPGRASVLSVEAVHLAGAAPDETSIAQEIMTLLPSVRVEQAHRLPRSVKVCSPTLKNARLFDGIRSRIEQTFDETPVYFTGMRTDTGVFFSHHTIGLAYEAALDCRKRLS